MIFALVMYVPNWLMFLFDLVVGITLAWFCYTFSTTPHFVFDFNLALYGCTFAFAIIAGFIFSYSNYKGISASERNRVLQSLSGSITHEMRNPLFTIHQSTLFVKDILEKAYKNSITNNKNNDQIIISKKELEEALEFLEISDLSANHGQMVINMILEQIHEKPVDKTKFQPFSVLVTINEMLRQYAFGKGEREKVIINIDKESDFAFKGDETMLIFALFNLLKNSLYYCKNYPQTIITISSAKTADGNSILFKDTGPGVPKEKLPTMFESFKTSGKKGGTGLGLPFCKRIMESFGGTIECSSELGKWTEFVLNFPDCNEKPIKEYQEKLSKIVAKTNLNESEKIVTNENILSCKKTIIITDDEAISRKFTRKKLEILGFNVIESESVIKTMEILDKHSAHLIFMDMQMPDFNGIDATKMIRSGEYFKNYQDYKTIPIISLSAYPKEEIGDNAFKNDGVSDYLEKGAKLETLIALLNKWLELGSPILNPS